jgi:hypothetical protein
MTDISKLLADPNPEITLDQLAHELNELAKIRNSARFAFCKRLAMVYLLIVGHPPQTGVHVPFYKWCSVNIRSATGKPYTFNTLRGYLKIGFADDPQRIMRERQRLVVIADQKSRAIGSAIRRAVTANNPPAATSIPKLKAQGMPTDVAREVNVLMTAWEQASSQARSQFMYMITGKRIAV